MMKSPSRCIRLLRQLTPKAGYPYFPPPNPIDLQPVEAFWQRPSLQPFEYIFDVSGYSTDTFQGATDHTGGKN